MDETDQKICNPKGLKIELFDHQKTTVYSMMKLEEEGSIQNGDEFKVCASILSEMMGSGKTLEIISLILLRKIPGKSNYYVNIPNNAYTSIYKVYNKHIKSNLIFVSPQTLHQWLDTIACYTDLSVFVIDGIAKLRNFYLMYKQNLLNNYDIYLVKVCQISSSINREYNYPFLKAKYQNQKYAKRHIVNEIADISFDSQWGRVIYDDFDTSGITNNCLNIPSRFTWFVSATINSSKKPKVENMDSTSEHITYYNSRIFDVFDNKILLSYYNLKCNENYILNSQSLPKYETYIYTVENDMNWYIDMIRTCSVSDKIIEALNEDAIEKASELADIKINHISELFKNIFQNNINNFRNVINKLNKCYKIQEEIKDTYIPFDDVIDTNINIIEFQLDLYELDNSSINLPTLNYYIDVLKNKKEKYIKVIERIKSKLLDSECYICFSDYKDGKTKMLYNCCGFITCSNCTRSLCREENSKITIKCPQCRNINNFNELSYIPNELNTTSLGDMDIMINNIIKQPNKKIHKIEKYFSPKILELGKIIDEPNKENNKVRNLKYKNVISGNIDLKNNFQFDKMMVVAQFRETFDMIVSYLNEKNIGYIKLTQPISESINEFKTNKNRKILLLESYKYCSGIDLGFLSDLIFMNKICNFDIESQIVGRLQRLGRNSNLRIHYILYENENKLFQ